MTAVRALIAVAALAAATSAQAQTSTRSWPPSVRADSHRYQADQHRYEMERLRARADQREAFARQLQLETRLNRLEIEAARQPDPVPPPAGRLLRAPEQESALRQSATARRRATAAGVAQIDAWLDRPAD